MRTLNLLVITAMLSVSISCENEKESKPTISYPESGFYGENLLDTTNTELSGEDLSLAAELSEGAELKVIITALDSKVWYYRVSSVANWAITTFDDVNKTQTFTAINDDHRCDLLMNFNSRYFRIDYYEMGSEEVTFSKIYE